MKPANCSWRPSAERIADANLTAFVREAERRWDRGFAHHASLHDWSISHPDEFWRSIWEHCDVVGQPGDTVVDGSGMPGARWFPHGYLNYAQNLLRWRDDRDALVFWGEERAKRRLSFRELHDAVSRLVKAMRAEGVGVGDRVAAYMPNMPETIIVYLATASIGAVFTSASPDFGVQGVLDRFGQIEPKLLFVADGYWYKGKPIDSLARVSQIVGQLPALKRVIVVPYLDQDGRDLPAVATAVAWHDFVGGKDAGEIEFAHLPFDHPLVIMYSSGTTGVPKCIVHGAGGALIQHLKEHRLHGDVKPGDRFFYFTTCGWMMWNWLVSGLASGATLLLYDGSPFQRRGTILFDYADAEGMTHLGASAKFIDAIAKIGLKPTQSHRLAELRAIFSTGSPLVAESYDYVYSSIKEDVHLASISGGTDILSCFVGGNPTAPVYRGEIQCSGLGMAVDVVDEQGVSVRGEKGELVCTRPFPVMPLGFWNDADGRRYRAAYFERFPGIWCHGDFAERTEHDGYIIYGRSDATLNPGGVRIGTAEIYRQVERLDEIMESLVIGQNWPPGDLSDVRVVLFVRLREGLSLDDELRARIKQVIRENTTPRHVPAKILQVTDVPRTRSGKIVELAVRNVVHGLPVTNVEALANPEALDTFRNRTELST